MFNIDQYRREFFYDFVTVVDNFIPQSLCEKLESNVNSAIENGAVTLVSHAGKGSKKFSDLGGKYYHNIFRGDDVRQYVRERWSIFIILACLL